MKKILLVLGLISLAIFIFSSAISIWSLSQDRPSDWFWNTGQGQNERIHHIRMEWSEVLYTAVSAKVFNPNPFSLYIPLWEVALVTMVSATLFLGLWVKKRRYDQTQPLLCSVCGYDLRASTDRCPECGTKIPPHT